MMDNYFDDENIKLLDLLGVEELTKAQNVAAKMARMATIICDENGVPVTEGSNFCQLCVECRKTEEGRKRCENCDRMGAISALEQKESVYYYCHANLVDFSAPIMLNGRMIGSIAGGQVLAQAPNIEAIRKTAREIGADEDLFAKLAEEVSIIPIQAIERCAKFLYEFADMLSSMAYKTYIAKKESMAALEAATAKTDFLANMSHEIRTPMNAIIGMAQIAMREDLPKKARDYIGQVVNSADMLLTIINDILDYSKLEAGKMSIIESSYSPVNLIKEVSSIIANRVGTKDIEFIVDMDPSIPCELEGDDIRIKQIIVNLANNAVKFTNEGQVKLSVHQKEIDNGQIMLCCAVTDTGMGIKEQDLPKLFNSFEQVDSKRNRKVEGTGLGLAIVKELVDNMHGTIHVQSEYEKGSTFSFEIPQKVVNSVRSIELLQDCPGVLAVLENTYVKEQLQKDMNIMGAQYMAVDESVLYDVLKKVNIDYVFVEEKLVTEKTLDIKKEYPNTKLVILGGISSSKYQTADNQIVINRPLSIINTSAVLLNKSVNVQKVEATEQELNFRAPDAKVLIVDDNEVNLAVAVGLLEPLEMQMDTAESGMEAIQKVSEKHYDIIFMDHMMPEMDGIETTNEIRKRFPQYGSVPIIALTANALAGNREEFFANGLDDFVAKPIELSAIVDVLKKWLPKEKIQNMDREEMLRNAAKNVSTDGGLESITFLDTAYALSLLKSEKLYWKIMKDYYHVIDKKLAKIKQCEATEDIGIYIIEVHALKSSSRQIGALSLSKKAENLEAAGNRHDMEMIHRLTDEMLEEYRNLQTSLAPYFLELESESNKDDSKAEIISTDKLKELLDSIAEALEELDFDKVEEVIEELSTYKFDDSEKQNIEDLKEAASMMDIDTCAEIIEKWVG